MSRKDGMVKTFIVTCYAGRTVIHREWIEVAQGNSKQDLDYVRYVAERYLKERRKEAFIAGDGHTQIPIEEVLGKLRYSIRDANVRMPRYYDP